MTASSTRLRRGARFLRRALLALTLAGIAAVGSVLGYRAWMQHRVAQELRISTPNGIESHERVTLGGTPQWVLLRGWDRRAPVLLFLHGGPGFPETAVARLFCKKLERHFVVVHWDQRGAGKSHRFGLDREGLSIQRYLDDTRELIEQLRARFGLERIYLVGHSWGSVLGVLTTRDHPEWIEAYVGIGQVVDWKRQEEISYGYVLERARETSMRQALAELSTIKPPYNDPGEMWLERKWLSHFGGDFVDGEGMRKYVVAGAFSPYYSALDGLRFWRGLSFHHPIWRDEIRNTDLLRDAPRLEAPVYFLAGRHDYNTPFTLVQEYYERLEAPRKELIWFEHSAHSPNLEEPERFQRVLIEQVLGATDSSPDRPRD